MTRSSIVLLAVAVPSLAAVACSSGGGGGGGRKDPLPLPASFQPGGITSEADTTLFVGSLAHPQIVEFAKGKSTSTTFLSTSGNLSGVGGLYWSDAAQQLYTC